MIRKSFLLQLGIIFILLQSCNNKQISTNTAANIKHEYDIDSNEINIDSIRSSNFYKSSTNKDCELFILPVSATTTNAQVVAYFFINDNAQAVTTLCPIYLNSKGKLQHNKSRYKILGISNIGQDALEVTYKRSKKFLFFDFSRRRQEQFIKNKTVQNVFMPDRYYKEVFDNYGFSGDIQYGKAVGYWTNCPCEGNEDGLMELILSQSKLLISGQEELPLLFDYYYPVNDCLSRRPLVMLIHGGGFFLGDKRNPFMSDLCPHLAKCGYSVVSIDYRLGFGPLPSSIDRIGYKALQDSRAALRFLVHNADEFCIDTSRIYIGGTSAGAITCLNIAFMDNDEIPESAKGNIFRQNLGGLDASSNDIKDKFNIKAVVNLWGAVSDTNMITPEDKVALLSVHGDADRMVPIDCDNPFQDAGSLKKILSGKVSGSRIISRIADRYNFPNELIIIRNAAHAPIYDENSKLNDNYFMIKRETTQFLANQTYPEIEGLNFEDIVTTSADHSKYSLKPASHIAYYEWEAIGGCIVNENGNIPQIVWLNDCHDHILEITVYNNLGISKTFTKDINSTK